MYGMCLFLGARKNVDRLDQTIMKDIVAMFNLPANTSYDRLRIIYGEPNVEYKLESRLLKVYHKYVKHFNEIPEIFRVLLRAYFEDSIIDGGCDKKRYSSLASELVYDNLNGIFQEYYGHLGYTLRENHRKFLM